MTRRTKNVVAFLPATQTLFRDRKRKAVHQTTVDFSRVEVFVGLEIATSYRALNERTSGALVGEKIAFLKRLVTRLVSHFLLACNEIEADRNADPLHYFGYPACYSFTAQLRKLPALRQFRGTGACCYDRISDRWTRCRERNGCGWPVRTDRH